MPVKYVFLRAGFICFAVFCSALLWAQDVDTTGVTREDSLLLEGFGEDDLLEGFGDDELNYKPESSGGEKYWSFSGDFTISPSYNYNHQSHRLGIDVLPFPVLPQVIGDVANYRGLTRLRLKSDLEFELRLPKNWKVYASAYAFYDFAYRLKGREDFTSETLDAYESEIEWQETYIQGSLTTNLDLRFGRQIINWGRADNIRVLDVLNPLDLREPGMVDIEDLRLPVTMTRLDYLMGNWTLMAAAIHEIRFHKYPVLGNEFYPLPIDWPEESMPANTFKNTEYAAALSAVNIFPGTDFSLHFARFYNDAFHLKIALPQLLLQHARLTMFGASIGLVRASWLFKSELAVFNGLKYSLVQKKKSRFDLLLGLEYSGFKNTVLALDFANSHVLKYDKLLALAPDQISQNDMQMVTTMRKSFIRETAHLIAVVILQDDWGEKGAFARLSISYDWSDNLEFAVGTVQYKSGELLLSKQAADNDRIFFDIKYSF